MSTTTKLPGGCNLCGQRKFLADSHVLSEFLYREIYDSNHKMMFVSQDAKPRKEQKGFREPLLCFDCEGLLSVWEDYAAPLVSNMKQSAMPSSTSPTVINGVDYHKFKLFLMSILWRAGIASGDLWKQVRLGKHENRLRNKLRASDPGESSEYGCLIKRAPNLPPPAHRGMIPPTKVRMSGGHRAYAFVFEGFGWYFYVSSHTAQLPSCFPFLSEQGDLYILPDADGHLGQWANNALKFAQQQKQQHEK